MASECECKGTGFITVQTRDITIEDPYQQVSFSILLQKPCSIHNSKGVKLENGNVKGTRVKKSS